MKIVVILERSNKNFSRFIELIKNQQEIRQLDITQRLPRSSYYGLIMKRVFAINKALKKLDPYLYLAEPSFQVSQTNHVYTSIRRCPSIEIESKKETFIVRCNHGKKSKEHPDSRNP